MPTHRDEERHQSRENRDASERRSGAIWWGVPTGVLLAVWLFGIREGFGWSNLVSSTFAVYLVVCVTFGYFAGRLFGNAMGNATRKLSGEDDELE